ncbi:hypothetical protein HAX54_038405, partial [Datura stramonium]|nr:hypothetical protein [Datura stramonium]
RDNADSLHYTLRSNIYSGFHFGKHFEGSTSCMLAVGEEGNMYKGKSKEYAKFIKHQTVRQSEFRVKSYGHFSEALSS